MFIDSLKIYKLIQRDKMTSAISITAKTIHWLWALILIETLIKNIVFANE